MNENENNIYHYSDSSELPRDDYQKTPSYAYHSYTPEEPPRKKHTGLKVAALLLACALVAGGCGFAGTKLAQGGWKHGKAELQETTRQPVEVVVKEVDGQKAMTPAEVYAANVNSTVSINTKSKGTNVFGQPVEGASSGSGFIISADGYIVTNYHVVEGASTIKVTLYNGDEYTAKFIGGEADYDVAVLKVEATGLSPVTVGKSKNLNVGEVVLAIGNPLGELTFSMSQGIVSCCNRTINVDGTPFNMIQTDASINPGNSGGPLLNLYGEVVGIVSAKYSTNSSTTVEGLGFAIPIDDLTAIISDIMENGSVTNKPYFAITAGSMTESMAAQYRIDIKEGVFVYSVEEGGAGDRAGLRLGDVITKIDDTPITSYEDLTGIKKHYRAGDTATLTVFRNGEYITTEITFDAQPDEEPVQEQQQQQQQQQGGNRGGYDDFYDYFFDYFFGNRR